MIEPPTIEVWVAWGDSEMAGAADPATLASVAPGYPPASGLSMLRSGELWSPLSEPCADGAWPPVGVGPAGLFGWLRAQQRGGPVAIINLGVGGTRTDEWLPSQALYRAQLPRAQAAVTRPGSYLGGFLQYIGANDAAAGMTDWTQNSSSTLAALYATLGVAPLLYAVLPPTVPTDVPYPTWAEIRAQQANWAAPLRVPASVPEGHWREPYKLHLDAQGNLLLAQAWLASIS